MNVRIVSSLLYYVVLWSGYALCDEDSFLSPCYINDIECLNKSTATFLEKTHKGILEYGFVAIDPLNIPELDVHFGDDVKFIYKYKNVIVTGLKNQSISDYKMDIAAKSVVLTTKADLKIVGDSIVQFLNSEKSFAGALTATACVLGTATYNYELRVDDNNIQFFELAPETITCKVVDQVGVQLNPEFNEAVSQDDDFKKISKKKMEELRSQSFCEIVIESYKSVINNIRVAAKFLPASAFFKDEL